MSARPGLCGGHWVTGVPTAIANRSLSTSLDRPKRSAYKGVQFLSVWNQACKRLNGMSIQFLLFVIALLLVSIFWVLSKINSLLKKTLLRKKEQDHETVKKVA